MNMKKVTESKEYRLTSSDSGVNSPTIGPPAVPTSAASVPHLSIAAMNSSAARIAAANSAAAVQNPLNLGKMKNRCQILSLSSSTSDTFILLVVSPTTSPRKSPPYSPISTPGCLTPSPVVSPPLSPKGNVGISDDATDDLGTSERKKGREGNQEQNQKTIQ